jgi:hypothetical protein
MFSFSQNLNNKGKKNNKKKKKKKQRNEQPWTLTYILVLQMMSSPWNFSFWSIPISFPSKTMPCKFKSQFDLSWSWTLV